MFYSNSKQQHRFANNYDISSFLFCSEINWVPTRNTWDIFLSTISFTRFCKYEVSQTRSCFYNTHNFINYKLL